MPQKYTTSYFENDAQLYKEKNDFQYLLQEDARPVMHIGFNINDPFFRALGAEITSILETNRDLAFHFHVFVDSYAPQNKENLEKTAKKYGCNVTLYVMDMAIYQNFHIKVARFSRVTYIRIVMPWILRHVTQKYLYLDSDMICIASLKPFLSVDLHGKAFGAMTFENPERVAFLKMKQSVYFCDGLMWVDIQEWIREQITERVFSYQGADPRRFKGQTQDLLNLVLEGNIYPMPRLYHHHDNDFEGDGLFYHYAGRDKPWEVVLTHEDEVWRHYLDISFWESMPDPMPPKQPAYYHTFKKLAHVYGEKGQHGKQLKCLFWYVFLKLEKIFVGKQA